MDATDTNERDPLLDADTLLGDSFDGDEDEHLDDEASPDHGAGQGPAQIGRFVVLQRLGEGGMGVVYAAYDNELDRKLAIKLVRPERAAADTRVRVKREAKAMARLSHPNVVHVYEVGEFEEQVYVAMEFVTGPTLGAWVRGLEPPGSPPAQSSREPRWQMILEVYIQAGRGLEAAHAAGIVHRDFKPENAILGEDGRVRVLDFGIARGTAAPAREPGPHPATASASGLGSEPASATSGASSSVGSSSGVIVRSGDSAEALPEDLQAAGLLETAVATGQTDPLSTPLTMTGAWVGTPAYMSPEQFRGHDIDARSDQFGFAVALYEALYDQRPFAGKNPTALMNNVVGGKILPAPPGSEVPHWLRAHLLRALSVVPGRRWPTMTQLLDALEDNPERRRRRRRRRLAIAGASLLVLSGLGGFANDQWQRAQQAEEARIRAQAEEARAQRAEAEASAARDRALAEAEAAAVRARDTARVLAAATLDRDPTLAAALLRGAEQPGSARGWRSATAKVLGHPLSRSVLQGHGDRVVALEWHPSGRWLASAGFDGRALLWALDEDGRSLAPPLELPHADKVYTAVFSPDGRWVLTASRDHSVRLWPVPDAVPSGAKDEPAALRSIELRGNEDLVWTAVFSPDGRRVASAGRDGKARVWDLPEDLEAHLEGDALEPSSTASMGHNIVWEVDFSPDGTRLVAANEDGTAVLWRVDDPRELIVLLGAERRGRIAAARFSPDGRFVYTGGVQGSLRIYPAVLEPLPEPEPEPPAPLPDLDAPPPEPSEPDAADPDAPMLRELMPERTIPLRSSTINRLRFSADGRSLAVATRLGAAMLFEIGEDGLPVRGSRRTFPSDAGEMWTVDLSPDGRWLATGSRGTQGLVWPLDGGPPVVLVGHGNDVFRTRFSPAGTLLATASNDGSVRIWPTQWGGLSRRLVPTPSGSRGRSEDPKPPSTFAQDHSRGLLLAGYNDGRAYLFPVAADAPARPLVAFEGGPQGVFEVALHESGWLATALADGTVEVHATDALLARAGAEAPPGSSSSGELEPLRRPKPLARLPSPAADVRALRFDPTGRWLFASHYGGTGQLSVWDLAALFPDGPATTPEAVGAPEPRFFDEFEHADPRFSGVADLAFEGEGRFVAAGGQQGGLVLWSLPEFEERARLDLHSNRILAVAASANGRRVATASTDAIARVVELDASGRVVGEPLTLEHGGPVHDIALDEAGARAVTACSDSKVYLWDLERDPVALTLLPGSVGEFHEVRFAFDERRVVGVSQDGTVRVWNLDAGPIEDAVALGTNDRLSTLAVFEDGQVIVAGGAQRELWQWRLPSLEVADLSARLRTSTTMCLSAEQRMLLVGEPSDIAHARAADCSRTHRARDSR